MIALRAVTILLFNSVASVGLAQDRPSEENVFREPAEEQPREPLPQPGIAGTERGGPGALEREPGAEGRLLGSLARTEDPLKIGGLLYLRSNLSSREHTPPSQWALTVPTLTDVYLDVRPTDRVRGFVLGRMFFDPTLSASSTGVLPSTSPPPNPQVLLDQIWLSFDVAKTAFLTLGRQHVKWGVGRFWNPTDYLHAVRRDPLAVFDERTGTTMLRVHVPWEKRGWNLYGVAIAEPLVTQPTSALGAAPQQPAAPA